jgi:hypothetical protein
MAAEISVSARLLAGVRETATVEQVGNVMEVSATDPQQQAMVAASTSVMIAYTSGMPVTSSKASAS